MSETKSDPTIQESRQCNSPSVALYGSAIDGMNELASMYPGTVVRQDCIERNGLSVTAAARILGVDRQTLSNLLNARSGISSEMAVRLEKAFETSFREWLIRQVNYELAQAMRRINKIGVEPFRATAKSVMERHGRA